LSGIEELLSVGSQLACVIYQGRTISSMGCFLLVSTSPYVLARQKWPIQLPVVLSTS